MNLENQLLENKLLEKFQVEELEKRYEFSWIEGGNVHPVTIKEPNGYFGTSSYAGVGVALQF